MKKTFKLLTSFTLALILAAPISAFAYGAIAIDDEAGEKEAGYGYATGESSEKKAKAAALKQCKESGNDDCKVMVTFKDCGAYASSSNRWGVGSGSSKKVAEAKALAECGAKSCKIQVSDCE